MRSHLRLRLTIALCMTNQRQNYRLDRELLSTNCSTWQKRPALILHIALNSCHNHQHHHHHHQYIIVSDISSSLSSCFLLIIPLHCKHVFGLLPLCVCYLFGFFLFLSSLTYVCPPLCPLSTLLLSSYAHSMESLPRNTVFFSARKQHVSPQTGT